jgi:hypothetical protein
MHTLRFGRKLGLPPTIAIKHQVRKLMAAERVKNALAAAGAAPTDILLMNAGPTPSAAHYSSAWIRPRRPLYGPVQSRGRLRKGSVVADPSKATLVRAGVKALPQHDADAQLLRENAARQEDQEKAGKPRQKGPSLSDWLAAQQNEGRRG